MQSALSARRLSNDSIVMDRYALIKFSLLDKEIKTKEHAALFADSTARVFTQRYLRIGPSFSSFQSIHVL